MKLLRILREILLVLVWTAVAIGFVSWLWLLFRMLTG